MRMTDKRLQALGAEMPATDRVLAALDAIKADDDATLEWLKKTAPRLSYTATEAAYSDTMDAVSHLALHFDRAFYKGMADISAAVGALLISMRKLREAPDEDRPALAERIERLDARVDDFTDALTVLAVGLETFAHRLGIDVGRLMAMSMVLNMDAADFARYRNPPAGTTERLTDDINDVADTFASIWRGCGNEVVERFGPPPRLN